MSPFVDIRAKIKAKLDTLTSTPPIAATPLALVFNGEQVPGEVDINVWPCAELVRLQTEPAYLTNREDQIAFVFAINIYQELGNSNFAAVEVAMDSVVDVVMQAFLDDAHLTGTLEGRIRPVQAPAAQTSWVGKTCRRDTIFLSCPKVVTMA